MAVYVDGEPVVDLWGGYADAARTIPWQRDTITNVWSATKTMTALCALILADRGDLDLAAPVARYWPEFAAAGKEDVRVRHLLAHTAGLPDWDEPMTVEDLYDWPAATARLAAQAPRWEPGTAAGYHSLTQGFLVGEVVRRVTGQQPGRRSSPRRWPGRWAPTSTSGCPPSTTTGWRPAIPPPSRRPGLRRRARPARSGHAAADAGAAIRVRDGNSLAWRRARDPRRERIRQRPLGRRRAVGAGMRGTARGVRLLSPAGCERARGGAVPRRGPHPGYADALRHGLRRMFDRTCGWGGWGGSMVMVDLDARMTVSYVMNQMLDQGGWATTGASEIVMAAYEALQ